MLGTGKMHPAMSRRGFLTMAAAAAARRLASGRSVRLRVLLPEGSGPNVLPVSEAFTAMTGIAVEHQETLVDETNLQITIDRMSDSTAYDVALPATFGLPNLAQVGAIRPLSDFARKYEPRGLPQAHPLWRRRQFR